jgi:hypothetical protein
LTPWGSPPRWRAALAENGLSCNVLAAFHHDHLLVSFDEQDRAIEVLESLARRANSP